MLRQNQGWTLVETVMVIAIIAILAVLGVAPYFYYLENNRLRSAGEGLYNDLSQARAEAIKQQTNVLVVYQTGSNWCYGKTTATTCDCAAAGSCNLGQTSAATYPNTTLSATTITTPITFNPNRGTASSNGSLTFTGSSGRSITVELNALGMTKICSATVGGYKTC